MDRSGFRIDKRPNPRDKAATMKKITDGEKKKQPDKGHCIENLLLS